jgi:hypothetical protein
MASATVGWSADMDRRLQMIREDPEGYVREARRGTLAATLESRASATEQQGPEATSPRK